MRGSALRAGAVVLSIGCGSSRPPVPCTPAPPPQGTCWSGPVTCASPSPPATGGSCNKGSFTSDPTRIAAVRCVSPDPSSDLIVDICSVGPNDFNVLVHQTQPSCVTLEYQHVWASWNGHFFNFYDTADPSAARFHLLTAGWWPDIANLQASDAPVTVTSDLIDVTDPKCGIQFW